MTMRLPWGFLALILTIPTAAAQDRSAYVHAAADGMSWTIGNNLVEREVRFSAQHGLSTESWRSKVTGTDFMRVTGRTESRGREFAFTADGHAYAGWGAGAGGGFELESHSIAEAAPSGKDLRIVLRSRDGRLRVTVHYAVYAGHPVIRKWIEISNVSAAPLSLSHLVFEAVNLAPAAPDALEVSVFYGQEPREIFYTGRVDDAAITVRSSHSGEGYVVMNEAPGYLKRTEMVDWGEGLAVVDGTTRGRPPRLP